MKGHWASPSCSSLSKIFFNVTHFLKSLLNLLQDCFCFMFWFSGCEVMWDLSSPTRDWTPTSCLGRWSHHHRSFQVMWNVLNPTPEDGSKHLSWAMPPGAVWDSSWIVILWAGAWDFRLGFLRQPDASCLSLLSKVNVICYVSFSDITHIWNLKKLYKWTYLRNRNRLTDRESNLLVIKVESESHSVMSNSLRCHGCSSPWSSVHGILQARILEWVAFTSSRGSSQPRDGTHVSCIPGGFFTVWATGEPPEWKVWGSIRNWGLTDTHSCLENR